jgi:GNAT superfamily N-acetyltransferase
VGLGIEVRRLRPRDDRSAFSCGEAALDRFFRHYAGQNQFKLKLAVTYVVVLGERILGFATVAAGSVEKRALPEARSRRRLPAYPLPILRLARFGVEEAAQGAGIGRRLLRHVFDLALEQVETSGCLGVVTDAKPGAVPFYESLGFISLRGVREGQLHGDASSMFLDIESIRLSIADP